MYHPGGLLQEHWIVQTMTGRQIAIKLPPTLRACQFRQVAHPRDIPAFHRQPDVTMGARAIDVCDRMKGDHRLLMFVGRSEPKALERHVQAISQCTEPLHHSLQSVSFHAFFSVSPKLLPGSCIHLLTIASDKGDRKSTRLNSSHLVISYAVFCLKKKKKKI